MYPTAFPSLSLYDYVNQLTLEQKDNDSLKRKQAPQGACFT